MNKIKIYINHINFLVKLPNYDYRYKSIIEILINRLSTYKFKYDYHKRRNVRVKDRVFAAINNSKLEYRFNINMLKDFIVTLGQQGVGKEELEIYKKGECTSNKLDLEFVKNINLKDYQVTYENILLEKKLPYMLVDLMTGYGKATSLDTKIRISDGWKFMRDIEIGDKVIGRDGLETNVVGVYPQGIVDMYRITFEDGRSSKVSGDHLWSILMDDERKVMSTLEVKEYIDTNTCYIDLPGPEVSTTKEYDISPSSLGMMINNNTNKIYNYIPTKYLNGSIEQRYELLGSLLHTNLNNSKDQELYYATTSNRLANDITLLARSLGYLVFVDNNYSSNYYITIKSSSLLAVRSIEKIASEEAQCIAVDNKDKLFVIDDYIVTHNTILSTHTIVKINRRFGILVLPKYIDKWISDVKELTNIQDNELYVVKGGSSLNNLVTLADNNELEAKVIIFSIRTISNYIKEYENALYEDEFTYECKPEDLMERLGIGLILNDETHQEFHAVFKSCLYLDPCRFIGLSATLDHNDANIRKMYNIMFPGVARISNIVEYQPYIHVVDVTYSINSIKRIKYKRPQGYNHILYEDSIIKNNLLLKSYTEMIEHYFKIGYLDRRVEGDKILIFVASIKMATILTEHFSMKYDDLDVRRYVEDDPYENVMEGDVVISTVLSSGTALDIKGLITIIQTISIKSLQAVKQAYGRLRNLKDKEMYYYSLHCKEIPNHSANARSNKGILLPMSKYWEEEYYNKILRVY